MATAVKKPALSGPGLKKQGVVVLQSFFISYLYGSNFGSAAAQEFFQA